jgi:hypothetical protein
MIKNLILLTKKEMADDAVKKLIKKLKLKDPVTKDLNQVIAHKIQTRCWTVYTLKSHVDAVHDLYNGRVSIVAIDTPKEEKEVADAEETNNDDIPVVKDTEDS